MIFMSERLVYSGWLKLYKRLIGNKEYEILKNHDAVSAIVLNEFDEILLVKQFRPSVMRETLEIPAGVLDITGEPEESCIIRELEEETALKVEKNNLQRIVSYKPILGFSASNMTIFKTRIKKDDFNSSKIKDVDVTEGIWLSFEELEDKINSGEIVDDKTIMSYFHLKSSN
ncbi:NUDIX hydrolase [Clostridium tetani]|nr:NUDIX hydrolase [Clostridium tetani]RXI55056.1 NUDIX hydrolase [Clostridium tetani]RXI55228.1 NUDIX hydrolase [Clostridium tetani]RXI72073.1 NUDIX hydrolase [Clostridium tetani]RXI75274.1 NUDIX hydrolase [Clostridium tetani]